jgi:hypothetical protein
LSHVPPSLAQIQSSGAQFQHPSQQHFSPFPAAALKSSQLERLAIRQAKPYTHCTHAHKSSC